MKPSVRALRFIEKVARVGEEKQLRQVILLGWRSIRWRWHGGVAHEASIGGSLEGGGGDLHVTRHSRL
ncbi:MAG: hypothetical protein NVSMB53_04970 [Gemmatimonadaceae bacterium]